ncbi:MAG: hypothetical protein IID17_10935, partial [Nitrospinae bacterium]|nr:hypothetical protein [Nitrospinota bacterium]
MFPIGRNFNFLIQPAGNLEQGQRRFCTDGGFAPWVTRGGGQFAENLSFSINCERLIIEDQFRKSIQNNIKVISRILLRKHDLIDFEAGARVAGHGFYFLKNEAVLLELALVQFAVTKLRAAGYTLCTTPDLARDDVLEGIGFIPRGSETQIYSIENDNLSLVATAEITLGGMLKDQVLDAGQLPIKLAGISHCFRNEAGAHGRATRGIYRVHQFTKVEMFGFTAPDLQASNDFVESIVGMEEEIFQELGIPYRVIDTCTGDLGGPAYRKFDLEAWMFREKIHAAGYVVNGKRNRLLESGVLSGRDEFRLDFVSRAQNASSHPDAAAVLAAIGVGARHLLTREQWDRYAKTGT